MKTSSYTAKSQLHAAETSQQELRSIKRSGATLLLVFTALFTLIFFSSCEEEDENENEMEEIASNTELSVSAEVEGEYKALGSYFEHFDADSELYVNSFEFMDQYNPAESTFLIGISRFSQEDMELTTG